MCHHAEIKQITNMKEIARDTADFPLDKTESDSIR